MGSTDYLQGPKRSRSLVWIVDDGADRRIEVEERMRLSRRHILSGLLGMSAGALVKVRVLPAAADTSSSTLEIRPYLQEQKATGHLAQREFPVSAVTPSTFQVVGTSLSDKTVVVGCSGLVRQVQFFDGYSGDAISTIDEVTSAQRGVQEIAHIADDEFLAVSASGCHTFTLQGDVSAWPDSETWFDDAYEPRSGGDGFVWVGTYGPGGAAKILRLDTSTRSVEHSEPFGQDVDYVRRLAISSRRVWGGTGSVNPRLVAVDRDTLKTVVDVHLPQARGHGTVYWIRAWDDVVAAGYRGEDGKNRTAIYDIASEQFTILTESAYYALFERVGESFFFFDSRGLVGFQLSNMKTTVIQAKEGSLVFPVWADLEGDRLLDRLTALYSTADESRYILRTDHLVGHPLFGIETEVTLETTAQKIQTIFADSMGRVYAAGYLGESMAVMHANLDESEEVTHGDAIRQVESIIELDDELIVASYPGARIARLDKTTLELISTTVLEPKYGQSRPFAMTADAGSVYVASVPSQGLQGGGVVKLNRSDGSVESAWERVVHDQSVVGIALYGAKLVVTTSQRNAYGAEFSSRPARVLLMDFRKREIEWEVEVLEVGEINSPIVLGTIIYASHANGFVQIEGRTGKHVRTFRLHGARTSRGYRTTRIAYHRPSKSMIHCSGGQVTAVHIQSRHATRLAEGGYSYPIVSPLGDVFAIRDGTTVVKLDRPVF
ncbi:hypothetical protein [Zhihengliuella halotolerans]|uniref:hypothetical protein n=1 Tax=Zhihengliuella halotolerans TaxID=370736 RepID=UPI0015E08C31|nr:hypothetical protein [Zhihengliuella halotolerans]